jgi:hypothetical protein
MGILFSGCFAQRASLSSARSNSSDPSAEDDTCTSCIRGISSVFARMTRRDIESRLHHWRDQLAPGEGRVEAATRIMDNFVSKELRIDLNYLNLSTLPPIMHHLLWLKELNLSHNNLNALSQLPTELDSLDIDHNQFTALPKNLPKNLSHLCISHNHLTELLVDRLPQHLRYLNISHNQLHHLPEGGLEEVESLLASHNQLTQLPDNLRLSSYLQILEVPHNQITHLPNHFFRYANNLSALVAHHNYLTHLPEDIIYAPRQANISVENNLFSQQVLTHLQTAINATHYGGPRIYFSQATDCQYQTNPSLPRLERALAMWFDQASPMPAAQQQLWQKIARETDAQAFARFLERLHDTVNYNPTFKLLVIEWLNHLAEHPQLRAQTFAISLDASASCEDRVSLSFNQMKHARLAYDIDTGKYDDQITTVMNLARGMFRLDALEKIARIKAASLHFIDEIEVYLAYQVKLRDALELPLDIGQMRFFEVADVTEEDLAEAINKVRDWEKTEFSDYLASVWSPWQVLLKRCDPAGYADNQKRRQQIIESIDNTAFSEQVKAQMQLFQDLDAQAQRDAENGIIKEICDTELRAINRAWTESFLSKHQLSLSSN